MNRLPEAWIAPPALRELRELVRYRAKLVQLRSGLKAQVHAVMAKEGVLPKVGDMFSISGNAQLDEMELGRNYTIRVADRSPTQSRERPASASPDPGDRRTPSRQSRPTTPATPTETRPILPPNASPTAGRGGAAKVLLHG